MLDAALAPNLGTMPAWNLADLYPGMDSPELQEDFQAAEREAKAFASRYKGKLASLSAVALVEAIRAYESQDERYSRIMTYAGLLYASDQLNAEIGGFFQNAQEKVVAISSHLLFFTLELNKLNDAIVEDWLADPAMRKYGVWLQNLRIYRPHQLSDELEKFLHEQHVVGAAAWNRLFDETMAGLRFTVEGEELSLEPALTKLSDPNTATRKAAAHALGNVFAQNLTLFARITNTLAKEKEIDDRWRGYPRSVSARNLGNQVEDEVVDALVKAVRDAYPRLSHRYYALRPCWRPMPTSRRGWRRWASAFSTRTGSMRRRGQLNTPARFRTRRCRACILISC